MNGNGFEVERAFYAGALPLMLTPIALILRPPVERVAVAVFAAVSITVVLGLQPFFGIARRLPGFTSSYNTRPLAPEVMVDGTRFAVVRSRPTIDEMLSAERFPPWMETA